MRRWARTIAAAAYLALCLAVPIFWLRSHFCTDHVAWSTRCGWQSVRTAAGHLQVDVLLADWSATPPDQLHGPRYERTDARPPFCLVLSPCSSRGDIDTAWQHAGFAWYSRLNPSRGVHRATAVVPCWLLAVGTLFPPVIATVQRFRRRRLAAAQAAGSSKAGSIRSESVSAIGTISYDGPPPVSSDLSIASFYERPAGAAD